MDLEKNKASTTIVTETPKSPKFTHESAMTPPKTLRSVGIRADADAPWRLCLEALRSKASSDIAFKLPKANAIAGGILLHSIGVIEGLFTRYDPLIFKIGITHNPEWRWCNSIYGYQHSCDKWSNMVVFSASPEPHGPSMLEAALIEKYRSILSASEFYFLCI